MTDIKPSYNMDCGGTCFTDQPKILYLYIGGIPLSDLDRAVYDSIVGRLTIQQGGYLPLVALRVWDQYIDTPYMGEPRLTYHEKGQPIVEVGLPLDVDFSTIPWQNVA